MLYVMVNVRSLISALSPVIGLSLHLFSFVVSLLSNDVALSLFRPYGRCLHLRYFLCFVFYCF